MRVLMFGWEFPPHIAGGLGTACEGIVKGLAYNGVESIFVMPSASGDEAQSATRIINASDVAVENFTNSVDEFLDKVKFIHIDSNLIPYADPEEFSRIVEDERARLRQLFATHPDGLYLAVMYYTGMRPGEVRGLQWGDIDWDANLLHVVRDIDYAAGGAVGGLKTEKSQRYIPVADALRALLYPARQAPAAFVFPGRDGKPLAQVTAARMWIRLMAAAGFAEEIPDDEKTCYGSGDIRGQYRPTITPHAMRHNFITMCWEQGVDIVLTMRMVGHTDSETTRNIYTHLSAAQMESARAQLDSIFGCAESQSCRKVASPSPCSQQT